MSDATDNVVLNLLRAIRTTQLEHGHRLTSMEMGLARLRGDQASDAETRVHGSGRMDAMDERLDLIERRLELRG